MRYPCSYMIYSDAFDALPAAAKDQVYRRLWQVLSGQDKDARYAVLSRGRSSSDRGNPAGDQEGSARITSRRLKYEIVGAAALQAYHGPRSAEG